LRNLFGSWAGWIGGGDLGLAGGLIRVEVMDLFVLFVNLGFDVVLNLF
jgi:hypothetical protein